MNYSFSTYMQLREELGFGLSPTENDAVTAIMQWIGHGAPPDQVDSALNFLQSGEGLQWVAHLLGGPTHNSGDAVNRVVKTVLHQFRVRPGEPTT